jgi:hypothetical protein
MRERTKVLWIGSKEVEAFRHLREDAPHEDRVPRPQLSSAVPTPYA